MSSQHDSFARIITGAAHFHADPSDDKDLLEHTFLSTGFIVPSSTRSASYSLPNCRDALPPANTKG